jgi:hypothetical protein
MAKYIAPMRPVRSLRAYFVDHVACIYECSKQGLPSRPEFLLVAAGGPGDFGI